MSIPRNLVVPAVLLVLLSGPASAQSPALPQPAPAGVDTTSAVSGSTTGPLRRAALQAALRLEIPRTNPAARQSAQRRCWVSRHPVLFSALVGGVAGSLVIGLTDGASTNPEPGQAYPMGFALGAGVGALVGVIVDSARK